jgi:type I restriction enzyme M protein
MTSNEQRAALQRKIWDIANDVRGAVDGWDFKQYVLGTLFYRFISENFIDYVTGGDTSVDYAAMADDDQSIEAAKDDAIKTKGYFIYPSHLFVNVAASANANESLNTDLANIFKAIEASASGYPSELDIKGLFADFDTTSNRLGNTVKDKNSRLAAVLKGVAELDFGGFDASHIDLFGDAYEFLISNYAANAGKSGGEFFTPQQVSKLIAQLAMHGQTSINKIYDPACGSGSLLLQAKKHFDQHLIEDGFFGQEINHTTYNLARMNMFLHNVNYDKFNIELGNTLEDPHFAEDRPFDAIVSNPPYSVKWIGSDDPTLINDERFAPAGVLAPKSKADFAFVLHALNYLSAKGRAAIVCFPGIFYRSGAEQRIRQYLVDNNYVESVISLAPNLFFGTTIAVNILVLSKHKSDTTIQFIDASGEDWFKKEPNINVLLDAHIERIVEVFDRKTTIDHFAQSVPLKKVIANDYNLSVSSYVEAKDTREVVDIAKLNAALKTIATRIDQLRTEIDTIVSEIEGGDQMNYRDQLLKFKDGDVEWKALGEIGEFIRGKRFTKADYAEDGVPAIHYGEIYTRYGVFTDKAFSRVRSDLAGSLRYAGPGDVVIAGVGETIEDVGKAVAWIGSDQVAIHDDSYAFRHSMNPKYVSYVMQTARFIDEKAKHVSSGKVNRLLVNGLEKVRIPVPFPSDRDKSLAEQARVVAILDKFDALTNSLTEGLPREIELRQKQYEYYRDLLLSFPKQVAVEE